MPNATIEVFHKPGIQDSAATGVVEDLRLIGHKGVRRVETAQLYKLVGKLTDAERQRAAQQLLADPIIQGFQAADGAEETKTPRPVTIDVWYKSGVTDVIGESVLKGLRDLGIDGVTEVRTGSRYRFWGLRGTAEAQTIADTLLSNPLIQDRIIHAG
jgi:phosphoribosylformylglycinamidine (FGAM) synthase PurS component